MQAERLRWLTRWRARPGPVCQEHKHFLRHRSRRGTMPSPSSLLRSTRARIRCEGPSWTLCANLVADNPGTLNSVRSAARLLKQFSSRERELGVSELARKLDLGKSTVHRLLVTLTSERLLEQDPYSGKYRLGIAMHDLGQAVSRRLDLHEAVIPPMELAPQHHRGNGSHCSSRRSGRRVCGAP